MSERNTRACVYDPLAAFMEYYADASTAAPTSVDSASLTIEEKLKHRIVDGDSVGLQQDLDAARERYSPLDIINSILLDGMKTVGELFGAGQMQLPFVLQSAETMKAAVAHLERYMDRADGIRKGCLVLATVKGDVHDIGKNLVDIILTNNGYKVVNLGIKVPIETILAAAEEHNADAIGMSGLLVKSTLIMKENLELMRHRGRTIPVVLGGAALTRRFVEEDLRAVYDGRLAYANDAFAGLSFMEQVLTSRTNDASDATDAMSSAPAATAPRRRPTPRADSDTRANLARSTVSADAPVPRPPFFGSKTVTNIPLDKLYEYINEAALIRGQWQMRRGKRTEAEYRRMLEQDIYPMFEQLKLQMKRDRVLRPAVVYGFFPCNADGDALIVYKPKALEESRLHDPWPSADYALEELEPWQRFAFPRQQADRRLCLADFFRPLSSGIPDVCAFHIVTVGAEASDHAARLFLDAKYQEYLYAHGLSVEAAEALAEYWHRSIREELGIAGGDAAEKKKLFAQGYQGSRYSFGYPACPRLEDQQQLFALLRPDRIGVSLTEEFQLVPEQSTSALIVHHPEARYFNIKD
jgi:5-methyltetrahydrofolate--homocysteine methyltransferase